MKNLNRKINFSKVVAEFVGLAPDQNIISQECWASPHGSLKGFKTYWALGDCPLQVIPLLPLLNFCINIFN